MKIITQLLNVKISQLSHWDIFIFANKQNIVL